MQRLYLQEKQSFLSCGQNFRFCKKSVDETRFIGYNGFNIKNKGCEEKSRHKDAVQRAPVGVMGYG